MNIEILDNNTQSQFKTEDLSERTLATCLTCLGNESHLHLAYTMEITRALRQYRACVEEMLHKQAMSVEDVTITYCTTTLCHPCLLFLLFMASLFTTFLILRIVFTCTMFRPSAVFGVVTEFEQNSLARKPFQCSTKQPSD